MLLRSLGSGDAFGSGGRFQTCLHLTEPEGSLLIDCGVPSLVAIRRAGLDPSEIGWVLLTHLHGDHFGGVPFLILDGQFSGRTRTLREHRGRLACRRLVVTRMGPEMLRRVREADAEGAADGQIVHL